MSRANGKIIDALDFRRRHIDTIVNPFLIDETDPKHPVKNFIHRSKPIKVLTIPTRALILRSVIKRKDGKMATKQKTQTNYMQTTAVCLLAGGAVLGFADLLGGTLKACLMSALLIALLFVMAVDYRK